MKFYIGLLNHYLSHDSIIVKKKGRFLGAYNPLSLTNLGLSVQNFVNYYFPYIYNGWKAIGFSCLRSFSKPVRGRASV